MPSFVVSTTLFREFLESIHWSNPLFFDLAQSSLHVNVEDALQLQAIARQIQHTIAATPLPAVWVSDLEAAVGNLHSGFNEATSGQAVILRPSLTLKSVKAKGLAPTINPEATNLLEAQVCWTDKTSLEAGLKKLWAEVFRARNLLYWQRSSIQLHQIRLAVLVQPIVEVIASGYLQRDQAGWEVLATWGLVPAIAQGEALPDRYRLDAGGSVQVQKLGSKTVAYQVMAQPPSSSLAATPLQSYLLSDAQDRQFVLESSALQQLGQFAQRLTADFSAFLVVEWAQHKSSKSGSAWYFTQVSTHLADSTEQPSIAQPIVEQSPQPRESSHLIVSGLAAASGKVTAKATVISDLSGNSIDIAPGTILVTSTIMPDWLPLLQHAAGVIAEQGGMTSHGAIVARELGIPAVVGARRATQQITTGDWLLIDGDRGEVYKAAETPAKELLNGQNSKLQTLNFQAAMNRPPIATQLMVNLSQLDLLSEIASLPIDGVGLLRSELMMMTLLEAQHPRLWLQKGRNAELSDRLTTLISQIASAFAPRPVFYRSLDLRSHEFRSLEGGADLETNPMLGIRGTFSYLKNPDLFEVELTALSQAYRAGHTNLRLLLPFVRTVEEFVFCRQRVEQAGLTQHAQFQLWIMAEVPSVLFLLPQYVQAGVQGITIGTSDLTQLLLGVDRDQSLMASAFDEYHPAVLSAIAQLIKTAQQLNIPCSICGSNPVQRLDFVDRLIQRGITAISVNPNVVEDAYQAIARAEHRLLIEESRKRR